MTKRTNNMLLNYERIKLCQELIVVSQGIEDTEK